MLASFVPYFQSDYILLIKLRTFNTSIDFSSLNIRLRLLAHLTQIIEVTNDL